MPCHRHESAFAGPRLSRLDGPRRSSRFRPVRLKCVTFAVGVVLVSPPGMSPLARKAVHVTELRIETVRDRPCAASGLTIAVGLPCRPGNRIGQRAADLVHREPVLDPRREQPLGRRQRVQRRPLTHRSPSATRTGGGRHRALRRAAADASQLRRHWVTAGSKAVGP